MVKPIMQNKEYYTVKDLAHICHVNEGHIKDFIKDGTIKTVNIGKQYMLIPKEKFNKETKSYLDWILRNHQSKKEFLSDKIRVNFVHLSVFIIIPLFVLIIVAKIFGVNFLASERGQLFGLIFIVVAGVISNFLYKFMFPKYSGDFPDKIT